MDKLDKLFEMQAKLNDEVFDKQSITDGMGGVLSSELLILIAQHNDYLDPNSLTNQWLRNYLDALEDESRELREELLWKWWSKDTLNMQNIRVEIIDQLHFWLSLAITAGMDADMVMDLYQKKSRVNHERQEQGYCKETKDESDNKGVK
jgi:dimeric dUTPase (all-alpha-NTP-PPase superfamily)